MSPDHRQAVHAGVRGVDASGGADQGARARQVELILEKLESLPTLSPIATRLLGVGSSDTADINKIVGLIESDPALSARILGLCRRADRGLGDRVRTVKHAVVMIGLDAVRSAALAVNVYDVMNNAADETDAAVGSMPVSGLGSERPGFDRVGFWKHSLAVACAAELIAKEHPRLHVRPEEAFAAGLLHDLGKLVLELVLPQSYGRVLALADFRRSDAAPVERAVLGLDHHTAGKRVAEQWGLPGEYQDAIWLHSQPYSSLPPVPHRGLIAAVSAGEALARRLHIGFSGDFGPPPDLARLCSESGLDLARVEQTTAKLNENLSERCTSLGIDQASTPQLLLEAIAAANRQLHRLNSTLAERSEQGEQSARVLGSIAAFHKAVASHSRALSPGETLHLVLSSARALLGEGFYAAVGQFDAQDAWRLLVLDVDGRLKRSQVIEEPLGPGVRGRSLASLMDSSQLRIEAMGVLPSLTDLLHDAPDIRGIRSMLIPIAPGSQAAALILHDRPIESLLPSATQREALTGTWSAALTAAAQHHAAQRLGERLAVSGRALAEAQDKAGEAATMARLGEVTAGAAHEMNNPLTVIRGRAQLLSSRLKDASDQTAAVLIAQAAEDLSDLISSLHTLSERRTPKPETIAATDLISRTMARARLRRTSLDEPKVKVDPACASLNVDAELLSQALAELVLNAAESGAASGVAIEILPDPLDQRLQIRVVDNGPGLSRRAQEHAFDPFFSDKPAGRQRGLGLTRAKRFVEDLQGSLTLENLPRRGAVASIALPNWRPSDERDAAAA
jgi:putative nucleotidyltransferase with HDIG domain